MSPAYEPLGLPSVHPVQNVQKSIEAQASNVVGSNVLDDSDFVEHDNLWEKSEGLEPKGERPSQFPSGPSRLNEASEDHSRWQEYFQVREIIAHGVVSLYRRTRTD